MGLRVCAEVLGPADFAGLYRPEWSNALCENGGWTCWPWARTTAQGWWAWPAVRRIGESMWQIGVDVLPGYRRRGVQPR
ncbi:MAG: hypothetical protein ACLR7U_06485 [Ruthenibacterium lactatiformans]